MPGPAKRAIALDQRLRCLLAHIFRIPLFAANSSFVESTERAVTRELQARLMKAEGHEWQTSFSEQANNTTLIR
jgi:hypothetical protein